MTFELATTNISGTTGQDSIKLFFFAIGTFCIILALAGYIGNWINMKYNMVGRVGIGVFGSILFFMGIYYPFFPSSISDNNSDNNSQAKINSGWLSNGENVIFKGHANTDRDAGVVFFREEDYDRAIESFNNAVKADRNDPEVNIYLNNAIAKKRGSTLLFATVVPAENGQNNAEALLRGVADAQTKCNERTDVSPIEIIIGDDGDKPERAKIIAQELANNPKVLGVIGHFSSSTTEKALREYEKEKLVVVTPASTSNKLKGQIFFRAAPSDGINGAELAHYTIREIRKKNISTVKPKIAGFYNPKDPYSDSIWQSFKEELKDKDWQIITYESSANNSNFNEEKIADDLYREQVNAIALFPNTSLVPRSMSLARAIHERFQSSPILLGGDTLFDKKVLTSGGSAIEGLVIAVPWFPENQKYAMEAEKKWGGQVNWISAMSFDATQVFCHAIDTDMEMTRSDILENVSTVFVDDSNTSGQSVSFNNSGEVIRSPKLVQVSRTNTVQDTPYGFKVIN